MFHLRRILITTVILFGLLWTLPVSAQDFSSNNFTVVDPVLFSGGLSSSASFSLTGVVGQPAVGTSTATSFNLASGFLYFPFVSTPTVTATPAEEEVDLSWTSADASTGWAVGGYAVGQSTSSAGPYTYTDVGTDLTYDVTSLTNGTTYYFVVRVKDDLGNFIATSSVVSTTPPDGTVPGGGYSGAGGGYSTNNTGVTFSGRAYPLSRILILKDGQIAVDTIAGPNSTFDAVINNLATGDYTFSVYGEDKDKIRSAPFTFHIYVTSGVMTKIGGIFIAPTISLDKSQVKRGDNISIFGQTAKESDIVISIHSDQEYFINKKSDADGVYFATFDSSVLEMGKHSAKSKASVAGDISAFGLSAAFTVGDENVLAVPKSCATTADLNGDCRVDLVDFSIAAFWYRQPLSTSFSRIERERLNGDGKVDLIDFSIMAFNWTG